MKHTLLPLLLGTALLACNTITQPQSKALGILELEFNSTGVSSAKFQTGLRTQAVTLRESDVVFGTGSTQVVTSTNAAHDYLVATFPVSHAVSSTSAFQNLTLYALAKNGNIGNTAIKTITNFGGVTDSTEQTRLAKHLVPVHAVTTNSGNVVIDTSKADFQAFTSAEVTSATTTSSSLLQVGDTILNYGFSARCNTNCTTNKRQIPTNGTGNISIAIRVPKAAINTTYKFVMNFVVLDEDVSRVTRGVMQNESIADAETRGTSVTATRLMQVGLSQAQNSATLTNDFVNDVQTSSLGASIQALGIGRIDAGYSHTCGLTSTGAAYCWGSGNNGQLGNGSTNGSNVPVAVVAPTGGSVLTFSSISAGSSHTCGIATTGAAYCWGYGGNGELGNGSRTNTNVNAPFAVLAPTGGSVLTFSSISAGGSHTCGLTTLGRAYCWGIRGEGQLGFGSGNYDVDIPFAVDPPTGGSVLTFSSISAGSSHTCGITTTGAAYCWGLGSGGAIGDGIGATFTVVPSAVTAPTGGSALTFSSITVGGSHTCGITTTGAAYCWGYGGNGELGNGSTNGSNVPVAVVAPTGGSILIFSSISAGVYGGSNGDHTCGITTTGAAYCWGNGGNGELGNNSTNGSNVPVAVLAPTGGNVLTFSSVSVDANHSCGITTTGSAFCWGNGGSGRLGNNSTTNSGVPVSVVSTNYNL
jgi:alpha-tubulin suppressor-like RCC1 family protein